ncbi:hypothetical protein RUND412_002926 [Rhizina undulata]
MNNVTVTKTKSFQLGAAPPQAPVNTYYIPGDSCYPTAPVLYNPAPPVVAQTQYAPVQYFPATVPIFAAAAAPVYPPAAIPGYPPYGYQPTQTQPAQYALGNLHFEIPVAAPIAAPRQQLILQNGQYYLV